MRRCILRYSGRRINQQESIQCEIGCTNHQDSRVLGLGRVEKRFRGGAEKMYSAHSEGRQDRIKTSILKPHRAIRKGWVARLGPGQIKGLIDLPGENWDIKWPYKASIKFDDSLISPTSLWRYAGGL